MFFSSTVFKAAPATPPSAAADFGSSLDSNFFQSIKKLLTNRNYILLLISYGLNVGVFYAISTLLNELVLTYYPVRFNKSILLLQFLGNKKNTQQDLNVSLFNTVQAL